MKILVAEDEPTSRLLMVKRLQSWGYEVRSARDGQEAWECILADDIQLVVTDWMMPRLDGVQLCKQIRDSAIPRYVYVILLTAKSQKEDLLMAMDMGADDFINKPFDAEELRVRIRAGERVLQLEGMLAARHQALSEANEKMRRDLQAAAQIQASLLPAEAPMTSALRFAWDFRPCAFIGGDTFNVFKIDEHHIGIYVLDVSGHGVPAAMLAVFLSRTMTPRSEVRAHGRETTILRGVSALAPHHVAAALNERFQMDETVNQYFTMIYGVLDTGSLVFSYVNAGHPPPLVVDAQNDSMIEKSMDPPIGMFPSVKYSKQEVQLAEHDRLFLFTDGLVDAQNQKKEFFRDCLLTHTVAAKGKSLDDQVKEIMTRFGKWVEPDPPQDDVTLIGVEVLPAQQP